MPKELKKILYIEDEEDIASIAMIALQDIGGFNIMYCASGEEALKNAESFDPDLIIVDVMMPEMDGPTTIRELKKNPKFQDTPFIFMTAKTQASEIKEYLAMGAENVITKPFDPITLADQVKEIWEKSYDEP